MDQKTSTMILDFEKALPISKELTQLKDLGKIDYLKSHELKPPYKIDSNIILYSCDSLDNFQLSWLIPLAKMNPEAQLFILAQQISLFVYQQISIMENIITIQLPCTPKLLGRAIQAHAERSASQSIEPLKKFPRFITDEPVRLMVMDSGLLISSRMLNYSIGGAFIEYNGISMRIGNSLKVNFLNQESESSTKMGLQLNGRVVWIKNSQDPLNDQRGVGVKFFNL